jgi:hypothetical protein
MLNTSEKVEKTVTHNFNFKTGLFVRSLANFLVTDDRSISGEMAGSMLGVLNH